MATSNTERDPETGETQNWDGLPLRFEAYGWHVIGPADGMDVDTVDMAIRVAKAIASVV
mgnify:CR=1 FL=1